LNQKRHATARQLPADGANKMPQLVGPRSPAKPTTVEIGGGAPLKVKAAAIPFLAALREYADVNDEALIEMAREKTYGRIHVPGRWVAIALLLGTSDVLPVHLR
jgi:hypothetical protein